MKRSVIFVFFFFQAEDGIRDLIVTGVQTCALPIFLQEAEVAATTRGGLGALLRREGLYSSLLTYWRREWAQGILEALTPQKRGPKSKRNPLEEENLKLQRQNARLTEDLRKAHIIIDVQKKVDALLGHPIPEPDPEDKS